MGLRVNNNVAALNAYRNLSVTDGQMSKSLEKLSSGFRINRAADDAAGLAISEGLRSQIGGLKVAVRNTQDGISVVQTAEGALTETHSILQRMRDLAVQASNDGGLNTDAKKNIQSEIVQLKSELDRIASSTTFNGKKLLDGSYQATFQVGANAGETIAVSIGSVGKGMNTSGLGLTGVDVTGSISNTVTTNGAVSDEQGTPAAGSLVIGGDYTTVATLGASFGGLKGTISYNGATLDLSTVDYAGDATAVDFLASLEGAADAAFGAGTWFTTQTTASITFTGAVPAASTTASDAVTLSPAYKGQSGASGAIALLDTAIKTVSTQRADLGAIQNRFDHTINNLNVAVENLTASESRIRDADMAQEMVQFTRNQILSQAGTAMLAQANQASQGVLSLLQG
jgi:flagellin-like hook-associated protein FlgL